MVAITPGKFKRILFFLGIVMVLVVAMSVERIRQDIRLSKSTGEARSEFASIERYPKAPPLPPLNIMGPEREAFNLSDYGGRYVLLNLWATWCSPCIAELPDLQRLKNRYKDGSLVVLAVSVDNRKDMAGLAAFLKKHDLGPINPNHVALYHDFQGNIQKTIFFNELPMTFLIGPKGRILYQVKGPADWDSRKVIKFLDSVQKTKGY
ncbi:MAG: hypothetical protein DHS20C02_03740 [Micavibrio sp.]|nr:MAG: hypothetical protein DHS20C02_03740 [Micavibrio sp.]